MKKVLVLMLCLALILISIVSAKAGSVNRVQFSDYEEHQVAEYNVNEGTLKVSWTKPTGAKYYCVKAILLNEEPNGTDSSQSDRAVKVLVDKKNQTTSYVSFTKTNLTSSNAKYLKVAVGVYGAGESSAKATWNWIGFKLVSGPVAAGKPTYENGTAKTIVKVDPSKDLKVIWSADKAVKYYVKAILMDHEPDFSNTNDTSVEVIKDGEQTNSYLTIKSDKLKKAAYLKFAVGAMGEGETKADAHWATIGFKLGDGDTPVTAEAPVFTNGNVKTIVDHDASKSLEVSWTAKNATRYQVKAILMNQAPDFSSNGDPAVEVLYDTEWTGTSLPFSAADLKKAAYLKVAVAAMSKDEDLNSAHWATIGFKLNQPVTAAWQMPMAGARVSRGWDAHVNDYIRSKGGRCCHVALDMNSSATAVRAAAGGQVAAVGYNSANGNYVIIKHQLSGKMIYSFYAHLASTKVTAGKQVAVGDEIGVVGDTGSAANDTVHLHFSIMDSLWDKGGYYGYVPHFENLDVVSYAGVTFYNPDYVIKNQALPGTSSGSVVAAAPEFDGNLEAWKTHDHSAYRSLILSWSAAGAAHYRVKAILMDQAPDFTSSQDAAKQILYDEVMDGTSLPFAVSDLQKAAYLKVAVGAYSKDETVDQAHWSVIGFRLDQNDPFPASAYTLTGIAAQDLVGVAETQIGYVGSATDDNLTGVDVTEKGDYTKYYPKGDFWCAYFVSWCGKQAGVAAIKQTGSAGPDSLCTNARTKGAVALFIDLNNTQRSNQNYQYLIDYAMRTERGSVIPSAGDLIFFRWKNTNEEITFSHVGIISKVSNGTVWYIDGNGGNDTVSLRNTSLTDTDIAAFCKLEGTYSCPHEHSTWKVIQEPTTEAEGLEACICDFCNATLDSRTLDKLIDNNTTDSGESINTGDTPNPDDTADNNETPNTDNTVNTDETQNPGDTVNTDETLNPGDETNSDDTVDSGETNDGGISAGDDTASDEPENKIEAFVTRCYRLILNRMPDAGGLQDWYTQLSNGTKTAAEIILGFVGSNEFTSRALSIEEKVEIMYNTMLNRSSDPSGKADWVSRLNAGQQMADIINGFCGSAEFKNLCAEFGIRPGSVTGGTTGNVTPPVAAVNEGITSFVTRCYDLILGRNPDEGGLNDWSSALQSGMKTASEIVYGFVYSSEFTNRNLTNDEKVEILYRAMLDRNSDPAGKADWVGRLTGGQELRDIINGFCGSVEFRNLCNAFGITPGAVMGARTARATSPVRESGNEAPAKPEVATEAEPDMQVPMEPVIPAEPAVPAETEISAVPQNIQDFVTHCYRQALNREPDKGGMAKWARSLMMQKKTAKRVAKEFATSGEAMNRNPGNEEYVRMLYKLFMNREADPEGLANWTARLDAGEARDAIVNCFADSGEFGSLLSSFGL